MSDLPHGWASATLGDVISKGRTDAKLIKGKLPAEPFDGAVAAYSASGQDVWCSDAGNNGPGIVLSAVGARCGKAFLADGLWTAIANTHALLPSQGMSARFLWYLLNNEDFWVKGGTAQPFVKISASLQLDVAVPPSVEQERIVAAIEEQFSRLDAGVAALERVRYNLKRMRSAVLQAACTGRLVRHTKADADSVVAQMITDRRVIWEQHSKKPYKEPVTADPFPLSVPDHWRIASLEALTDPVRVICYGILMPKQHIDDGIPYVRVKDMKGWTIDVPGLNRTSKEIASQYARASLRSGDVLLAIRGSYGRVAIIPPELDGANITQDSARIASHPALDHRYLLYYLGGSVANQYYQRVARGVAVKGVNIGDLRRMPVPVPPPEEQMVIADEVERQFSLLNQAEAAVAAQLKHSSYLRSSILAAAFSGKLSSRDSSDTPASILLERIASERASSNGHKPAKVRRQPRRKVTT